MNHFYVSIIFIGITLIAAALVWIAYDIKRSNDFEKRLEDKKKELTEIISDSEQMIEEMNKFSDYIVTQMDIKNEEMSVSLKSAEEKIRQLQEVLTEETKYAVKNDMVVNGRPLEIRARVENNGFTYNNDLVVDTLNIDIPNIDASAQSRQPAKSNVIPLNSRHKEVLKLSEKGMTDTEIAKTLNMGKGEIQLILGVNRQ